MTLLSKLTDLLWFPWLLGLFLIVGGYLSFRTGFFQLFRIKSWWKSSVGSLFSPKKASKTHGITQLQALSTALAATIGTGSIAGVATAIFYGGPGSVFWMWISAILGMITSCAEKTLAIRYRERDCHGNWHGGPMYYIQNGLALKPLAVAFSVFCLAETLVGGNLVQANSISTALQATFHIDPLITGIVVAILTGIVILGGIGRIGKVSERLVPCMALLFIAGGLIVLVWNWYKLPGVISTIFTQALSPKAAAGGYGAAAAMRYGIARGVFTNEAGLGTSTIAHAASNVDQPIRQGMWGIFEVFFATLVICSITALVILSSGVYDPVKALLAISNNTVTSSMLGAPLSAAAFSTVLGPLGGILVSVCLILFAFTSILGAFYYGEQCLFYLTRSNRCIPTYRILFLLAVLIGSIGNLSVIWTLVDLSNGLMSIPNLIALLLLSKEIIYDINHFPPSLS